MIGRGSEVSSPGACERLMLWRTPVCHRNPALPQPERLTQSRAVERSDTTGAHSAAAANRPSRSGCDPPSRRRVDKNGGTRPDVLKSALDADCGSKNPRSRSAAVCDHDVDGGAERARCE